MPTTPALGGSLPAAGVAALRSLLPASSIVADPEVLVGRSRDASSMPAEGADVVVLIPASTAKVSTVVRVARDHGLSVVAQGALTGLAGGANAVEGAGM